MDVNEQIYQLKSGGLTYKQVATAMGMTYNAVRNRYRRYEGREDVSSGNGESFPLSDKLHYNKDNNVFALVHDGTVIIMSGEDHRTIVSMYGSQDPTYSIKDIAREIGRDEEELATYTRLAKITHRTLPIDDTEILASDNEDIINRILGERKKAVRSKLAKKMARETRVSAEKWWNIELATKEMASIIGVSPSYNDRDYSHTSGSDKIAVVSILCDCHFGKVSKRTDTGHEYNTDIASKIIMESAVYLSDRLGDVTEVVIPFGGDDEHVDGFFAKTTRGTDQDVDGTPSNNAIKWYEVMVNFVEVFRESGYKIRLVLTAGNHNQHTALLRGMTFESHYRSDDDVVVDYRPILRKYIKHGNSLIGLGHASKEKDAKLAGLMSNESRDLWGETRHAYWFAQHTHIWKSAFYDGVHVVRMPTISPLGRWGHQAGFLSNRMANAYVIDAESGLSRVEVYNVP